jgi:hypothetical protein
LSVNVNGVTYAALQNNTTNNLAISTSNGAIISPTTGTVVTNTANMPTYTLTIPYTGPSTADVQFSVTTFGGDDFNIDDVEISVISSCDADNDNIPNSCDTDSDGDGCPDAVESGNTAVLTQTTIVGPYGANGLANSIENNDLPTATIANLPNATPSNYLNNTLVAAVNACADCDNDGVLNITDIDDDNDGILDLVECPGNPYKVYTYNRIQPNFATNIPVVIVGNTTQNATVNQTVAGSDLNFSGLNWKLLASNVQPDANNKITVSMLPTAATNGTFLIADAMLVTNGVNSYIVDNSTATDFATTGTWLYQNAQADASLNDNVYSNTPHTGKTAVWTFNALPIGTAACDADNDGIANSCDTDSDGDGCPDAVEAGVASLGTTTIAGPFGANGLANSIETNDLATAATTNVPNFSLTNYNSYALQNGDNACADCDNDGVVNIIDIDDDNDGVSDVNESNPLQFVNGTFTGGLAGWTNNTNFNSSNNYASVFAGCASNGLNTTLSQNIACPNPKVKSFSFSYGWNNGNDGSCANDFAQLSVKLGGIEYLRILTPQGGGSGVDNAPTQGGDALVTGLNGATLPLLELQPKVRSI